MDFQTVVDPKRGGTMGSTILSFSVFQFLTWVTTQAADIDSLGWQAGWCNDKSGADQNSGGKSLGPKDSKEQCLVDCKKEAGATGCEFHPQWGCSVHTKDVGAGSGDSPYQCFPVCPPGWRGVMDGCYYAEASTMDFTEAQNFCKAKNARMVLANQERKQQGLTKIFSDLTSKKLRFWIDARMIDGTLKTENGVSPGATWGDINDGRTGDCVRTGADFKWYKAACESKGESGGYTWNPMCKLL